MQKTLKRIENFEKLGFGLFIHYGLYSVLGTGEWSLNLRHIPPAEYESLSRRFTAKNFDGRELAELAKSAGCRYMTLTTRHHDGFSLYDTRGLNDYDAPHSAAGRDLVADFVRGCRETGILPVLYHTTLDWREKSFKEDFSVYKQYLRDSVEVLCRNYGDLGGLWFDGDWSRPDDDWEEDKLYALIRKYQPDAMIINNTGLKRQGAVGHEEIDGVTFEREQPAKAAATGGKHRAAEVSQVFGDHWGYAKMDINFKGLKDIITDFANSRRYRANYILNIGPVGDGSVRPLEKAMLEELGKWTGTYGRAIYEPVPSEIDCGEDFVLMAPDGKYYLYVYGLAMDGDPNVTTRLDRAKTVTLKNCPKIRSAKWMDNGEELEFSQDGGTARITATNFDYGGNLVVRVAEITAD